MIAEIEMTGDSAGEKEQRLLDIEKKLATARARLERMEIWAHRIRRDAASAAYRAAELMAGIEQGARELARLRHSQKIQWETTLNEIDESWADITERIETIATKVQRAILEV